MTGLKTVRWMSGALALVVSLGLSSGAGAKEGFSDKVVTLKEGLVEMLQKQGAAKLNKVQFTADATQKAAIKACGASGDGTFTLYKGVKADGGLMGTAVEIEQAGKEGPLKLLVAFKPEGTIYDLAFTLFGEERGQPAKSWNYLKQFVGKGPSNALVLGSDIDAVTGATYTSKAVASMVKQAACVYAQASKAGG